MDSGGYCKPFWLVHMNQKMIRMMYGRIGWMVHYVVVYFLNFVEAKLMVEASYHTISVHVNVGACEKCWC